MGAGTGGVLLLRWYWWRINAWSEISSMIAAFVVSMALQWVHFSGTAQSCLRKSTMITTLVTTAAGSRRHFYGSRSDERW